MKIGINLLPNSDTDLLETQLKTVSEAGYEHAEFNLGSMPLMIEGRLESRWLNYLKGRFSEYPLSYSAHIGVGLDCRNAEKAELHKTVLLNSVRAAAELGMSPLVLHYEKKSESELLENQFYDGHCEAAELAGELGIMLCLENIEVETVEPVIEMVRRINHPHMRMCYDVGHGFLASGYFGFDFIDSLTKAVPYLAHMHLSGNSGSFETLRITDRPRYDNLSMNYRFAYGSGDIHIPPLWGALPYKKIEETVRGFEGTAICEYYWHCFKPFLSEIRDDVDRLFNGN